MLVNTIGEIRMFAGNFAPKSWAYCDGQLVGIDKNAALFSIIGNLYGGEWKKGTFALPDLRGRAPVSSGALKGGEVYDLATKGGAEQITMKPENIPPHSHVGNGSFWGSIGIKASNNFGSEFTADHNVPAKHINFNAFANTHDGFMAQGNLNIKVTGGNLNVEHTGGGQPLNIVSPYIAINYIICTDGEYPSRWQ